MRCQYCPIGKICKCKKPIYNIVFKVQEQKQCVIVSIVN